MRFFAVQQFGRTAFLSDALNVAVRVGDERTFFAHFHLNGFAAVRKALMSAVHVNRLFQFQLGAGKGKRGAFRFFVVRICHLINSAFFYALNQFNFAICPKTTGFRNK